jgi:hypothetical protein
MNEIPSQTAEGPPIITVGELKANSAAGKIARLSPFGVPCKTRNSGFIGSKVHRRTSSK